MTLATAIKWPQTLSAHDFSLGPVSIWQRLAESTIWCLIPTQISPRSESAISWQCPHRTLPSHITQIPFMSGWQSEDAIIRICQTVSADGSRCFLYQTTVWWGPLLVKAFITLTCLGQLSPHPRSVQHIYDKSLDIHNLWPIKPFLRLQHLARSIM